MELSAYSGASPLVLALTLGVLAPVAPQDPSQPPVYPFDFVPVGAIRGHFTEGEFLEPRGVFFDRTAKEVLVTDSKTHMIGVFDPEGIPVFAFGGIDMLNGPGHVTTNEEGSIFVLDSRLEVQAFSYRGEPRPPLRFEYPADGALDAGVAKVVAFTTDDEGNWYVGCTEPPQVLVYDRDLKLKFMIRPGADELSFGTITGIAVSRGGLIAVLDFQKTPVQIFNDKGKFLKGFGMRDISRGGFSAPVAAAFDDDGYLYIVDMLRHSVKVFTAQGQFMTMFGGWYAESDGRALGEMLYPTDIAITPDHGPIYVAERFGSRVQIFRRVPKVEDGREKPRLRIPDVQGGGD